MKQAVPDYTYPMHMIAYVPELGIFLSEDTNVFWRQLIDLHSVFGHNFEIVNVIIDRNGHCLSQEEIENHWGC